MRESGVILHISARERDKLDLFVSALEKTLLDRGHTLIRVDEERARDAMAPADDRVVAQAMGWASELLARTGVLVLASATNPVSGALGNLPRYQPAIEVAIDEAFTSSAPHRFELTAEEASLPQEIAQVILALESVVAEGRAASSTESLAHDAVYTAEEEMLLQEHLRSLGYL